MRRVVEKIARALEQFRAVNEPTPKQQGSTLTHTAVSFEMSDTLRVGFGPFVLLDEGSAHHAQLQRLCPGVR